MKNEGGSSLKNFQRKPIKSKEHPEAAIEFQMKGRKLTKTSQQAGKHQERVTCLRGKLFRLI